MRLLGLALVSLSASLANAATVTIGAAPDILPPPAAVASSSPNGAVDYSCLACDSTVWGTFDSNQITATGRTTLPLPGILGSTAFTINASGPGTLRVFVTSQNNDDVNNAPWVSSFTSNSLPAGWKVTEQTFLDTANGLFTTSGGTVTKLGEGVFNNIGTSVATALVPSGDSYSVTHLYTVVASGAGSALSTINLQTPIPGALALFATGLLGLVALTGRRKRKLSGGV